MVDAIIQREAGQIDALISVLVDKARQACFVDIVVGIVLALFYGVAVWLHVLHSTDLWPLVAALAVTRGGDALKAFAGKARSGGNFDQTSNHSAA